MKMHLIWIAAVGLNMSLQSVDFRTNEKDDFRMLRIHIGGQKGTAPIAAAEFASIYQRITGKTAVVTTADDGKNDLVVIGSDADNALVHEKIIAGVIPPFGIRSGTDDYAIRCVKNGKRHLLFLAGGRPRALLYAVYRFFELKADCRYFWDGDIIPEGELRLSDLSGMDVTESPRFDYRGIRYFAHRSLNRFQAEHWTFDQWKQEIDWLLKKRLNLFMLRIGMDDIFQKAFPETVTYPNHTTPQKEMKERSFDDRNLFWSLEYRAELRRNILEYARERDLLHPEDVGTMTHWYSRTPQEYLDKFNPEFLPQSTNGYHEKNGLVWDIRLDKNLDAYFKLTEAHIQYYGLPTIFHTIGLAERRCYPDHKLNHEMKLYTYRRIIHKLREKYPNAPLLIASWDFVMHWTPEEVRKLVAELDPANTLIFDYTSDSNDEANNFTHWNITGRFPWICGFFHAYEPANEFMGNYDTIRKRLPAAADDPFCKGLVLWPENSHGDTLMLEFMPSAAWSPDVSEVADFIPEFCRRRYPHGTEEMLRVWTAALPMIRAIGWGAPQIRPKTRSGFSNLIFSINQKLIENLSAESLYSFSLLDEKLKEQVVPADSILKDLSLIVSEHGRDPFIYRDCIDMARSVLSRIQTLSFAKLAIAMEAWRNGENTEQSIALTLAHLENIIELETHLLDAHEDFSIYHSLQLLKKAAPVSPEFEYTLKGNAENYYCRTYSSELFRGVYLPEFRLMRKRILDKIRQNDRSQWKNEATSDEEKEVTESFYITPLMNLTADREKAKAALPGTLKQLANEVKKLQAVGTESR